MAYEEYQGYDPDGESIEDIVRRLNTYQKMIASTIVDIEGNASQILQQADEISLRVDGVDTDIVGLATKVSSAELKITDAAIVSTVTTSTEYSTALGGKENSIVKQTTAPSHTNGKLWLDTSILPNILYRSDGVAWNKSTPTSADEVGAYSSTAGGNLATRVSSAELKITDAAIVSTVTTSTEYSTALGGKENSIVKQTTAPSHTNGKLWLDTSILPNILYRSDGVAWNKSTPTSADEVGAYSSTAGGNLATRVSSAESSITQNATAISSKVSETDYTGNVIASLINQTATTIDIIASKINLVGAVTANAIVANAITTNELNVLAKGYVNNTTKTRTVEGWSAGSGTLTAQLGARNAVNAYRMRQYTNGNQMSVSDRFEVSALQMYKVTVSLYAGEVAGSRYLGLYAYDKDGILLTVTPFVVSTRLFGTLTSNGYFWSSPGLTGGWRDMVAYILPNGITESEIPEGKNVTNHFVLPENAATVSIRVLNYANAGVYSNAYWYGMEVTEADSGIINANQINVGTLRTDLINITGTGTNRLYVDNDEVRFYRNNVDVGRITSNDWGSGSEHLEVFGKDRVTIIGFNDPIGGAGSIGSMVSVGKDYITLQSETALGFAGIVLRPDTNEIDFSLCNLTNVTSVKGSTLGTSLLQDHANGSVTLSSQGGLLYLGYYNTTQVLMHKPMQTTFATGSGKRIDLDAYASGGTGTEPTFRPNTLHFGFLGHANYSFYRSYAASHVTTSRAKEKRDIVDVDNVLGFLDEIKPKKYAYRRGYHNKGQTNGYGRKKDMESLGVLVEDLEVLNHPLATKIMDDEMEGIDLYSYATVAIMASKDLYELVKGLQVEIQELKRGKVS